MSVILRKAKAANQGETHTWADGKNYRKVGKKWILVHDTKTPDKHLENVMRRSKKFFDYSMTTNLGNLVEDTLRAKGLTNFESLVEAIKTGPRDTAHKIYKDFISRVRATPSPASDRQAVASFLGHSLIDLKSIYTTQPKARLTVTKTSSKGNKYRTYEEGDHNDDLPSIKASRIQSDRKKLGGWSVTGGLSTKHVLSMLKTNAAKLIDGKPDARKKWILPKKAEDMRLSYTGSDLTITVKQMAPGKERAKTTARVEIKLPYTFAKAFLLNQIESKRTRNNFIFRLERSAGYRAYLEKYGA